METDVNSTMMVSFQSTSPEYTVQETILDGRNHLVVPVVMMVEGVHVGSGGAVLHDETLLSTTPEVWNGMPVTIHHPQKVDEEGNPVNVSANSPGVMEESGVGRIFHANYKDGLRAEAWIDEEKLKAVSPQALSTLRKGEPLEVSIGVFSDTDDTEGEWHGETYEKIARKYRPDHLALLPGDVGACSVDDGCGVRVNKKGGQMKELLDSFRALNEKGYSVSPVTNQEGFQEISNLLHSSINAMDTNSKMHYLEEVFQNDFVYRVRDVDGGSTLYRRGYSVNNGTVSLAENPVEVRKQVEFVANMVRTKKSVNTNNKKEGQVMSDKGSLCCEAKVDALIGNKSTHWQAKDREWLLEQSESTIAKMSPMEATPDAEAIQVNKDEAVSAFKESLKTIDDYTALMPAEMKAQIDGGVKLYKEHRDGLVKAIMTNTAEGVWEEDSLNTMNDATLEKIAKSIVQTPTDYSALGAGGGDAGSGEQVEVPVVFSREKKED